ncbi:MAG: response regulator [Chrysiogenetes bacterium]|nr:response regulator [Chrysiogenetes bacterium]
MASLRVLLVDDVQAVIDEETRFLADTDAEITSATDGMAALRAIKEQRPHVVFLDLNLPLMNGDVVCRAIKNISELENTAIIMVSADSDEKSLQRCYTCGADAYVIKPMTKEDMLEKLDLVASEVEFEEGEATDEA